MLVLTVRDGEVVFLGGDSFVTVILPPDGPLRIAAYSPEAPVTWDPDGSAQIHQPDGAIQVIPLDPSRYRLGIKAPDSVRIERETLRERRPPPAKSATLPLLRE